MQADAGVLGQPGLHVRVLVGGVVVADDVKSLARVGLGDLLEEAQELLVAVPGVAGVGHLAGRHLQRGEQPRSWSRKAASTYSGWVKVDSASAHSSLASNRADQVS